MRSMVYIYMCVCVCVGAVFGAQAQQVGGSGPKVPRQWICRERVTELGLDEVNVS